jgi:DNA-directed RNA polymerase subunit RPC12/RpoP
VEAIKATQRGYREKIKCPKCGLVQKAKIIIGVYPREHTCIQCGYEIPGAEWETIYTMATDDVICPYCGCEVGYYAEMADCDGEAMECDECGKQFKLEVVKKLEFTTLSDCSLNDAEHQWKESTFITSQEAIFYHCTVCDATKREPRNDG